MLFDAFDVEGHGELTLENFMCGVAIIRVGTAEQRLRFLFSVYDSERENFLSVTALKTAMRLVNFPNRNVGKHTYENYIITYMLDAVGARSDGLTFSEFKEWASLPETKENDMSLLTWLDKLALRFLPDPQVLALEARMDPTKKRKDLASATKLTETEVGQLQTAIERLKRRSPSGVFDRAAHDKVFGPHLSSHISARLFAAFDPDGTGIANLSKMVEVLAVCCRGTFDEKVDLCFRLFDAAGNGSLSADDMTAVVSAVLMEMDDEHRGSDSVTPPSSPPALMRRRSGTAEQRAELVASVYGELGLEPESDVSFDRYHAWIRKHPEALNFLAVLREVTRVELGVRPDSWAEERDVIRACYTRWDPAAPGRPGDNWYLVPFAWWERWCEYTKFDERDLDGTKDAVQTDGLHSARRPPSPGPIDNRELLQKDHATHLKLNQFPDHHFKLIAPRVWVAFLGWYGGGPPVFRSVIAVPTEHKRGAGGAAGGAGGDSSPPNKVELELYPPGLRIRRLDKEGNVAERESEIVFSRVDTLETVRARACKLLFVDPSRARLWQRTSSEDRWQPLADLSATIEEAQLIDQQEILLELIQADGSWPLAGHSAVDTGGTAEGAGRERVPGLVGLYNLGNTCFMNSALQCLSNTPPLVRYFLTDDWLYDVNIKSPMGTGGEVAVLFANLLRDLWTTDSKAVAPSRFKTICGKHKPQFNGYEQQDSQELLNFVLSSLNEDLNRVTKKPYVEQPDSDGRPDAVVAEEFWINHLAREQSIITLFTGQFKSLLTCSNCGHESARFEPFMFLPLPLVEPTHRFITVMFCFRENRRKPMRISLQVAKTASIADLRDAIVALQPGRYTPAKPADSDDKRVYDEYATTKVDVHGDDLIFTRLGNHWIADTVMLDTDPVTRIAERDAIYVYHVPALPEVTSEELGLQVGVAVEAHYRGNKAKRKYPGVITCVTSDGKYDIRYDDGDKDFGLEADVITILTPPIPVQITLLHRRMVRVQSYFLNPFQRLLFGVPYVMRVLPWRTPGYDMYYAANNHGRRFIRRKRKASRIAASAPQHPGGAVSRPSPASDAEEEEELEAPPTGVESPVDTGAPAGDIGAGGAGDGEDGEPERKTPTPNPRDTLVDDVIDEWGFVLRRVNQTGTACSRCDWLKGCPGCPIDPAAEAVCLWNDECLAIDWDPVLLDEALDLAESGALIVHPSVAENKRLEEQPLALSQCLTAFQRTETLEAFCGKCSRLPDDNIELREQIKSLSLWRVPPVLIIQLKRFQYNQYSRRKLNNLVTFPVRGFDLSPFMAKDKVLQPPPDLEYWKFLGGIVAEGGGKEEEKEARGADERGGASEGKGSDDADAGMREANFEGIPLNLTRDKVVYDLYAVVNHFGALGAGHYVAYAKNPKDKKWHCYNDRIVNDMDESAVLSPYAYLLFYMRRDCAEADIRQLFPRVNVEKVDVSGIGKLSFKEKMYNAADRCTVQ